MQWAGSYEELRDLLYREGLFDIRVVPGMTVPENLVARFALRTRAKIEEIRPEFPDRTRIRTFRPRPRGPFSMKRPSKNWARTC